MLRVSTLEFATGSLLPPAGRNLNGSTRLAMSLVNTDVICAPDFTLSGARQ